MSQKFPTQKSFLQTREGAGSKWHFRVKMWTNFCLPHSESFKNSLHEGFSCRVGRGSTLNERFSCNEFSKLLTWWLSQKDFFRNPCVGEISPGGDSTEAICHEKHFPNLTLSIHFGSSDERILSETTKRLNNKIPSIKGELSSWVSKLTGPMSTKQSHSIYKLMIHIYWL